MAVGHQTLASFEAMRIQDHEPLQLLVLFDHGQEVIAHLVADVLGHICHFVDRLKKGAMGSLGGEAVVGVENGKIGDLEGLKDERMVIAANCIDGEGQMDEALTQLCDYEFLYVLGNTASTRKSMVRFLSLVMGQVRPQDEMSRKQRSNMLSLPILNVHLALPNLEILSIGADAIELRVDLDRDLMSGGQFDCVSSLNLVGEQLMLLRQRTELPVVFVICSTKGNSRFPTEKSELIYAFLRKAIQWGCEYIDVELWLPQDLRQKLAAEKGRTKIISSWHDFSGAFKWSSPETERLFKIGAVDGDVVEMVAVAKTVDDNHELESFRSMIQGSGSKASFSGLNISDTEKMSRTTNKVFTPVTHPLLDFDAASGEMSATKINSTLHATCRLPAMDLYALSTASSPTVNFYTKCLNELSLPHTLHRASISHLPKLITQQSFAGCTIRPSLSVKQAAYLPTLTLAASTIGKVDTISTTSTSGSSHALVADNLAWRAIRSTLTSSHLASAHANRSAVLFAINESSAAETLFALRSLGVAVVYTIGFEYTCGTGDLVTKRVAGLEELARIEEPSVIVSTLPAEQARCISPVLALFAGDDGDEVERRMTPTRRAGRVFLDLSSTASIGDGCQGREAAEVARHFGWEVYDKVDVKCRFAVETMEVLCGARVPAEFVRTMSGRGFF